MRASEGGGGNDADRSANTTTRSPFELEKDEGVGTVGVKKGAGKIEGALGSDVPETPEVEAVDPDVAFGETVEADEALPFAPRRERPFEEFGELGRGTRPVEVVEVDPARGRRACP